MEEIENFEKIFCGIENPFRLNQPFSCSNLETDKNYILSIVDLQGKSVYQRAFSGGALLHLEAIKKQGLYLINIMHESKLLYSNKILIIY
jgi:hypothetical protein